MSNVHSSSRRQLLAMLGSMPLAALAAGGDKQAGPNDVEVWKEPTCGCCKDWIAHLEANGFKVRVNIGGTDAARSRLGMPQKFASCHTALVGGYAIEGHVPAHDIRRLLRDKPAAVGLAVPGMVIGSPGMDGPAYGGQKNPFSVLLVARDGSASVYQQYDGNKAKLT